MGFLDICWLLNCGLFLLLNDLLLALLGLSLGAQILHTLLLILSLMNGLNQNVFVLELVALALQIEGMIATKYE